MKKATMQIQGMHCASCASNIERSLSKVQGIKNVSVNLISKKAIIEFDDNVKEEEIKNAVKRTGYLAQNISFS